MGLKRGLLPFGLGLALSLGLFLLIAGIDELPLSPEAQAAGVRYVSPAGSDTGNTCTNPAAPCATLQHALSVAGAGDTIRATSGLYLENVVINQTVTLEGGWNIGFTARNPAVSVSTIRAVNPALAVVTIQGVIGNPAVVAPTVDGFTLTGARSTNHGGGLRMTDSNAVVRNNVITDNSAYLLGGGVWVQRGAPLFQNNRIEANWLTPAGSIGGGIELESTQATLLGNVVANNVVSASMGFGGGIAVEGGGPVTLTGNTISGNAAAAITSTTPQSDVGYGGGVYVWNAPVDMTGNLVQSNAANAVFAFGFGGAFGYGGGVAIIDTPAFTLTGNTVISNTAGYRYYLYLSGGGLEIESSAGMLTDNVIAANHANGNILFGNGGGLAVLTSTLSVRGGQILDNVTAINCEGYGGGLYASNSSITLDATRVESNCAANSPFYGLGGGLAVFNSPYTLTNVLMLRNRSYNNDTSVGGLFAGANSPGLVINNSFVNNLGQGIRTASPLSLTNNIIMGHTTGVSLTAAVPVSATFNDFYANTTSQRGFSLDVTNIVINPQLDATNHLGAGSPAIDAGTHSNAPDHDIDGESRPMIGTSGLFRVDIGADEFTGTAQRTLEVDAGAADLTIIGPGGDPNLSTNSSNDWIGYALMGGDVNGDGRADLLVSAEDWTPDVNNPPFSTGRIFGLFNFGTRRSGTIDLLNTPADLTVAPRYLLQHLGSALAGADLNADSRGDLVIGSFQDDNAGGGAVTPTVFALWGGPALAGVRTLTTTMPANFMVRAPGQDFFAFSAPNALAGGDLSGDGVADLAIGDGLANDGANAHAGAVFVVFGRASLAGTLNLASTPASFTLYGPSASAGLGLLALGHVNADAQLDLVARSDTSAYVLLGPVAGGERHLGAMPANVTVSGLQAGRLLVADATGDGQDDLILGSGTSVYVVPGPLADGQSFNVTSRAAYAITGVTAGALAAGYLVGDANLDLIVGAPQLDRAYVLAGGSGRSGQLAIDDLASVVVRGTARNLGWDVATADMDRDGRPDLMVSTWQANVASHPADFQDAGLVYLFYGETLAPPGAPGNTRMRLPVVLRQ